MRLVAGPDKNRIRSAVPADLAAMLHVEQRAEGLFPPGELPALARGQAPDAGYLAAIHDGLCWVAESAAGKTIGFIACARIGHFLHILEMDVLPEFGRRGTGSALLAQACTAGAVEGVQGLTLTTFRHLPWNQPFYEKHGFEPVMDATDAPHLAEILRDEEHAGFRNRTGMLKRSRAPDDPPEQTTR